MAQLVSSLLITVIFLLGVSGYSPAAQPSSAAAQLQSARQLFKQRRFAEAAVAARLARQAEPTNLEAWKLSGLSLQLVNRLAEAEQEFTEALKQFSTEPDLWFFLARVQYLQAELKPAEQAARRTLQLKPDHGDAHTQLAMVLDALNDYAPALTHYERAIELNRQQAQEKTLPLVYAAQLLVKLDRFNDALGHLTRAVALNPRASDIRLARGLVLEKLGRTSEAEKEYQAALSLDASSPARGHLARLKAAAGETKEGSGTTGPNSSITPAPTRRDAAGADPVSFQNRAVSANLNFVLRNGATGRKYQVETMTGGVAVLDYNSDGYQDIYLVNGAALPAQEKTSPEYWNRLFRNNRDGTFTDVTAAAKVAGAGYSMGVAVGDYDNDGHQDLFVAGVNQNLLFRNNGEGTFSDLTVKAGLTGIDPARGKLWSVAAAWLDYDNDGRLDLFVVNYCKWHPDTDPYCGDARPGYRTYCFPDRYEGLPNQLFRNNGDGTFTDVSAASGISRHIGKGMGVAIADYNDDGFTDIFVANDTLPNFLFRNDGRGRFEEVGLLASAALNDTGRPVSSMGVDWRDYDNDGRPDLVVSALEGETYPVFRNVGQGFFRDETYPSGLGRETVKRSGWSLGWFDFNNDGWKDLFTANAHVNDNIELYNEQTYRQPNSLFLNLGNGRFRDGSQLAGSDFQQKGAHRGAAFADFNNDGRIDVVTTALNEPAELWLNTSPNSNHWLSVKLIGTRSKRDGIGAKLKLTTVTGQVQFNHVTTSVGYASASDQRVHFGLGKEAKVASLEIRWPSGVVQVLRDVRVDQVLTVREPAAAARE